ncbi:hypothetical protein J4207_05985 [Candidatus Woesearchaeota archaeon]|nr:hypothetical protein [Candidatus Woesearchaeota archaeon]
MKLFIGFLALFVISLTACSTLNIFTGAAVAECDALSDNLRDTCYAEIGILRQDLKLCDRAEDSGSRFYCYEGIAESKNSSALCDEIEDGYWSNICFKEVGMNTNDPLLCNKITTQESKNACVLDVSFDTEDETLCSGIQDSVPLTERCFTKVAVAKKSLAVCRNLPPPFARDRCMLRVIYEIGDPSTCNFILTEGIQNVCFERAKEIAAEYNVQAVVSNNQSNP